MADNSLTLSIIIPVYNEEDYIVDCLDSIAKQTVMPLEVLVVDNNSTDNTVALARRHSFVTIIKEKRQHQVFAQAAGFNTAKGHIFGRIDADSILPTDWCAKLIQAFQKNTELVAVTGGADPYDVPLKWFGSAVFHGYIYCAGLIAGHRLLWGSNCAIRAGTWAKVKNQVLMRPDIWEDYDLAMCAHRHGLVGYLPGLKVGVSFRAMHTSFARHMSYQLRSVRTFALRKNPLRTGLFFLQWLGTIIVYPLAAFDDWLLKRRERRAH